MVKESTEQEKHDDKSENKADFHFIRPMVVLRRRTHEDESERIRTQEQEHLKGEVLIEGLHEP